MKLLNKNGNVGHPKQHKNGKQNTGSDLLLRMSYYFSSYLFLFCSGGTISAIRQINTLLAQILNQSFKERLLQIWLYFPTDLFES